MGSPWSTAVFLSRPILAINISLVEGCRLVKTRHFVESHSADPAIRQLAERFVERARKKDGKRGP